MYTKNMNKNDLRYIKTEKLIIDTFLECVDELGFENTFISTICERAMISRKTFYFHYIDKYELLNAICEQLKEDMIKTLSTSVISDIKNLQLLDSVKWCVSEADKHRELIRILLKSSTKDFRDVLVDVFSKYPARQIILNFDEVALKTEYEIISYYMGNAMIGFFEIWFNNYDDLSLDDAIKLMYDLVSGPSKIYLIKLLSDKKAILI